MECCERGGEGRLEALLRRSEALHLGSMEADRARLIAVAERLVALGAPVAATDAEGRTALHLAAGCGDKPMVLKLVELGTDVNCRDSVGGAHLNQKSCKSSMSFSFFCTVDTACDFFPALLQAVPSTIRCADLQVSSCSRL